MESSTSRDQFLFYKKMKGIDDLDDPQGLSASRIRMPGTSSERATPGWYKLQSKKHSDK